MNLQATLIGLLIALAFVFLAVGSCDNPLWIYGFLGLENKTTSKHEALEFLGIAMGGVLVALQAEASHRRAKALENTAAHTEKGLRQERMKNAIEHLGNERDSVRLGGAYELFHLAEDTDTLRQTVLDILCAHIRQTTGDKAYQREHESIPSEEIQSLLTLLFMQNHCVFRGCRINLQKSWLNGADLREARLWMANLVYADLKEATLSEAYLQGSNLFDANLAGACLIRAGLQGANLNGTSLQASRLDHAKLQGSVIENTRLHGAVLSGAFLQGTLFALCSLQGANLARARLEGAGSKDWNRLTPFAVRIRKSIGQITDLSTNIFAYGLTPEKVESLVKGLSEEKQRNLRTKLVQHIGGSPSNELPEGNNANSGSYAQDEAEKWIAEYHKTVSAISADNG